LACLADAVYYDAHYNWLLPVMLAPSYGHVSYRDKYTYFLQCDRWSLFLPLDSANLAFTNNVEEIFSRSLEAIARCEGQANALLDKL